MIPLDVQFRLARLFGGDCYQQEVARGTSPVEAIRRCTGLEPEPGWPAVGTALPPRGTGPRRGLFRPRRGPKPCGCQEAQEREDRRRMDEHRERGPKGAPGPCSEAGAGVWVSPNGRDSRWGFRSLGTGAVPARRVRDEALAWMREVVANGQDRFGLDQGAWEENARRLGFGPDEIAKGWAYIEGAKDEERMVGGLERVLREMSSPAVAGNYLRLPTVMNQRMPRQDGAGPVSWPWHTKAAAKVYAEVRKIANRALQDGETRDLEGVLATAMSNTGIEPGELTPEDDAIMGIAVQWELMGKDVEAEPPPVATARSVGGMKGTQQTQGRLIPPRGAP